MRSRVLFLLKYYLFWILASVMAKCVFLLYQGNASLAISDYFRIVFSGLRMDFSLGGYILLLSSVIMVFPHLCGTGFSGGCFHCCLCYFW